MDNVVGKPHQVLLLPLVSTVLVIVAVAVVAAAAAAAAADDDLDVVDQCFLW